MFEEDDLLAIAGPTIFARGEDYVRYVHGLRVDGEQARASIQARRVYTVRLRWPDGSLDGQCSCPHHASGAFCKHLVAVGLAVLGDVAPVTAGADATGAIDAFLASCERSELVEIVIELVAADESALRLVQSRALAAGTAAAVEAGELVAAVNAALPRGFVDYRASFDAARGMQAVLDDLERLLDAGAAEQTRPAFERALTRLRRVMLGADDSAGVLGDACQRAAELHARACREGNPNGTKLARWLVRFRADSPGWPDLELPMYAAAFDEQAWTAYRKAVAKLDADTATASHFDRFEVDEMLLELADHDGDVDEAVRLLSRDHEHVSFGAIVERLRAAGRSAEALDWLDRAVGAGRIDGYLQRNAYWISPEDAAAAYLEAGRGPDAIAVLRANFERHAGPDALRQLLSAATRLGTAEDERAWAVETAVRQAARQQDGSVLVRIALADGDLVAAWAAAEKYTAGGAWRQLAEASAEDLPVAAAELYRPELDRLLREPNTRLYPEVARVLATMRALYAKVGEQAVADALIADIRERYKRRTSLVAALDRAGLR